MVSISTAHTAPQQNVPLMLLTSVPTGDLVILQLCLLHL